MFGLERIRAAWLPAGIKKTDGQRKRPEDKARWEDFRSIHI